MKEKADALSNNGGNFFYFPTKTILKGGNECFSFLLNWERAVRNGPTLMSGRQPFHHIFLN